MTTFVKRAISGVLFVLAIVGGVYLGKIPFFIIFMGLMLASLFEFYNLALKAKIRPQILLGLLFSAALFLSTYFYASGRLEPITFLGFLPLFVSIFIIELYRNHQRPFHNIAYTLLGILYIGLPFSLLNLMVLNSSSFNVSYDPSIALAFFALTWSNDTGAYLFGVSIGKHKMFPRVSPNKSWEGFAGGIAVSALAAWVIAMFVQQISLSHWLVIGFITATMGVFGDLVESMFKRSLGVKDSGKFLPGHGGLLDRFDAILLSTPVVVAYLEVMMLI